MAAEQASREQAAREQAARDAQTRQDAEAKVAADKASAEAAAAAEAARQPVTEPAAAEEAAPVSPISVLGQFPTSPDAAPAPGLDAVSPLTTAGFNPTDNQVAALADTKRVNEVRDAFATKMAEFNNDPKYQQLKYGYDANNDPAATISAFKSVMGPLAKQDMTLGVNKNGEDRVVSVDVPTNSWADVFGRAPTYAEAKALQAAGLGNMTNVNPNNAFGTNIPVQGVEGLFTNDPGQTADSVVAATDFTNFVTPLAKAAAMFIPGMSLAMTIKDLADGTVTVGDIASNFALGLLAKQFGISAATAKAMINGDFGSALSSTMLNQLNPALAKELGVNPALAGLIGKQTGAYGTLSSMFSGLNQNWGATKSLSNAFNTGLQNIGITMGTGGQNGATGQSINTGFSTEDALDHYLNTPSNGGGGGLPSISAPTTTTPTPTPTPTPTTTPSSPLSSVGASSGTSAGASTSSGGLPSTGIQNAKASEGKLLQVGEMGSKYTPYGQELAQLNLAPDEFTTQADIGNIPTYNMDIAKAATAPFAAQNQYDPYSAMAMGAIDPSVLYSATGGSVQHFNPGGAAESTATTETTPSEANMLAYYRSLAGRSADADVAAALKSLSSYDSTTGVVSPKAQMLRMGQMGTSTPPKVLPQLAALLQARGMRLAEGGQPEDHKHPNYDGTPVFRTGGLSGLGGKYVEGKGDGTSDDITAMLADGEYVFSADVVSALGNGSNKAGAQALDKTVEAIRSRARSTAPDKLPPDAKSPLEYMQSVKGKKYG
jgi:hypothetical protein